MNVKEFSEAVGVNAHTIRYYDKLGLLGTVRRRPNGHRVFSRKDVDWIRFIQRLKDTGMPVAQMLVYARLRAEGDATLAERRALLQAHHAALAERIARQQEHQANLADKIAWYDSEISRARALD